MSRLAVGADESDWAAIAADESRRLIAASRDPELSARARLDSRERAICGNARWAYLAARAYRRRSSLPIAADLAADVDQCAMIGLTEAADLYDLDSPVDFGKFAYARASYAIQNNFPIHLGGAIPLSRSLIHAMNRGRAASPRPGRRVGAATLAAAHAARRTAAPLEGPVAAGLAGRGVDHTDPADAAGEVASLLAPLPGRERDVVRLRAGLGGGGPRDRASVGQLLGISKAAVARAETSAVRLMRQSRDYAIPKSSRIGIPAMTATHSPRRNDPQPKPDLCSVCGTPLDPYDRWGYDGEPNCTESHLPHDERRAYLDDGRAVPLCPYPAQAAARARAAAGSAADAVTSASFGYVEAVPVATGGESPA